MTVVPSNATLAVVSATEARALLRREGNVEVLVEAVETTTRVLFVVGSPVGPSVSTACLPFVKVVGRIVVFQNGREVGRCGLARGLMLV